MPFDNETSRNRGRPREFDSIQVLDAAIRVFSERGYHGTSISDLTEATKLTQGSLYKAFKDKQGIFLAAFDRYRTQRVEKMRQAIGESGSGLQRLRNALRFYVDSAQGAQGRQGCLVVGSMAELSTFDPEVARHIASALERNEAMLADLIRQGQEDGSISIYVDRAAGARMLLCLAQGMRVVGKTGRSRAAMQAAVDAAMKTFD
jgi:AcrR family transcriptional regulator